MAGKSLKGSGLGSRSLADGAGVELAARQDIGFVCPNEHEFAITFSAEADVPTEWECPRCGAVSKRADGVTSEPKEEKPVRTHWDMLRERRSIEEIRRRLRALLEGVDDEDTGNADTNEDLAQFMDALDEMDDMGDKDDKGDKGEE